MIKFLYLRAVKTFLKIFYVSRSILFNRITFYPRQVTKLEEVFRKKLGTHYAISFCNGTSALEAAIFSLRLSEDSVALVQADTFHASVGPIYSNNIKVRYLETVENSYTISLKEIQQNTCPNTKLIVIPHLFGIPNQEIKKIKEFCSKHSIFLIEDCSHSHFGKLSNYYLGTFGDISIFSLQGSKPISGGEGGILCTNNQKFAEIAGLYGHYGRPIVDIEYRKESIHAYKTGFGSKRRMHPLAADLALVDIKFIDYENNIINRKINKIYLNKNRYPKLILPELKNETFIGGLFYGLPIFITPYNFGKFDNDFPYVEILKTPYFNLSKDSIYFSDTQVDKINTDVFFLSRSSLIKYSSKHLIKLLMSVDKRLE